jgi:hypothetical protein
VNPLLKKKKQILVALLVLGLIAMVILWVCLAEIVPGGDKLWVQVLCGTYCGLVVLSGFSYITYLIWKGAFMT